MGFIPQSSLERADITLRRAVAALSAGDTSPVLETGGQYRQKIGTQLSKLRLSRMLSHHHIDREGYLHAQPILDIEEQMQRCSNCAETQRCDQLLLEASGADTRFCVNDDELQQLKKKLGSAA